MGAHIATIPFAVLEKMLKHRPNINMQSVTNAEEGLELVKSINPDVVLMDVSLPGMNGYDATRILKANNDTQNIPVIAITANAMDSDKQKADEAGLDAFITKPIDVNELLTVIDSVLT